MRRYLSLMESNFPTELGNAYRAMENNGNPWGLSQNERAEWADKLDNIDDRRRLEPVRPRVPLLGRLRRVVRRQEQEGHPGDGASCCSGPASTSPSSARPRTAPATRPPFGQRVHLPDAGHAEHRDDERHGREEDHHAVPALLQHAEERVPAARRQLRGRPPQPVPRVAGRDGQARHHRAPGSRSGSSTTTPATSVATTTSTWRPARSSATLKGIEIVEAGATAPRACAAAPAAPACGWRRASASRSTSSAPRSSSPPAPSRIATACPFCYIMIDDGVKGEGLDDDAVKVADIAMHVLEAIEQGEQQETAGTCSSGRRLTTRSTLAAAGHRHGARRQRRPRRLRADRPPPRGRRLLGTARQRPRRRRRRARRRSLPGDHHRLAQPRRHRRRSSCSTRSAAAVPTCATSPS